MSVSKSSDEGTVVKFGITVYSSIVGLILLGLIVLLIFQGGSIQYRDYILYGLIILLVLCLLLPFLPKGTVEAMVNTVSEAGANASDSWRRATTLNAIFVVLMLLILIGVAAWLSIRYPDSTLLTQPETYIALYIVLGVSVLLTLLLIITSGFSSLHLTDPGQPLGLPSGSIRAMIALILLLIFVLLGTFLFRTVSNPQKAGTMKGLTNDQVLALGIRATNIQPETPINGSVQTYSIDINSGVTEDGVRLAQQLLTTIGTLVVAVSGFYFGSRAVEEARPEQKGENAAPVIDSVDPTDSKGQDSVTLTIKGKNLQSPKSVKLTSTKNPLNDQAEVIDAAIQSASATEIKCQINVKDKSAGAWDVTVVSIDDTAHTLPKAFTISAPANPT